MTQALRTSDGSLTLYSDRYNESYHSIHGAETESRHIFLEASGVADRLRAGHSTEVLEIGFGLGLNCLLTVDLAAQYQTPLTFTSVETHVLPTECLQSMQYQKILTKPGLAHLLVSELAQHSSASNSPETPAKTLLMQLENSISCVLRLEDASEISFPSSRYHAIYHDAFSPNSNPECWSADMFEKLYNSLVPGGILTTYSAKGDVRRTLQQIGFSVQKRPGPPGKREFIIARSRSRRDQN